MKIHTMVRIVKKQKNFIFGSLATKTCQMCLTSTVGHGIVLQAPLFNLYWNPPSMMLLWDCEFYMLIPLHFYFILGYHLVSNWRETLFGFSVDK